MPDLSPVLQAIKIGLSSYYWIVADEPLPRMHLVLLAHLERAERY